MKKHVVVLGAGFGGLKTFLQLTKKTTDDFRVTLVDDNNFFQFSSLLHEVATGSLFPENITLPLRPLIRPPHDFIRGKVLSLDFDNKKVEIDSGAIDYDYLVLALGAETNYFDIPGAKEYSFALKNMSDAVRLKNHLIDTFESATKAKDDVEAQKLLSFVIVGGGPTGVELAAEMSDFFTKTLVPAYCGFIKARPKITIVQRDSHIIHQFSEGLRRRVARVLTKKGVEIILDTAVSAVKNDRVIFDGGQELPTQTVVWVAGVKASTVSTQPELAREKGRLVVNEFFQPSDFPEVFVMGDLAGMKDPQTGLPLPMTAQVADRQAPVVAKNICRIIAGQKPKPFTYKHMGDLISVGTWQAAGEIFGLHLAGRLTWLLWRAVYWSKMPTTSKKLQILLDWTIDLFRPRDISRLGDGDPTT